MSPQIIKLFALLLLSHLLTISHVAASEKPLSNERKAQLNHIVKQDCGSCHGMTLKGGLGPALLTENLKGKTVAFLQHTILYGRAGTAMPPWKSLLTEQEALWISQQLKAGTVVDH